MEGDRKDGGVSYKGWQKARVRGVSQKKSGRKGEEGYVLKCCYF